MGEGSESRVIRSVAGQMDFRQNRKYPAKQWQKDVLCRVPRVSERSMRRRRTLSDPNPQPAIQRRQCKGSVTELLQKDRLQTSHITSNTGLIAGC